MPIAKPEFTVSDFLRLAGRGFELAGAPSQGKGIKGLIATAAPTLGKIGGDIAGSLDKRMATAKASRDKKIGDIVTTGAALEVAKIKANKPFETQFRAEKISDFYDKQIEAEKDPDKKQELLKKKEIDVINVSGSPCSFKKSLVTLSKPAVRFVSKVASIPVVTQFGAPGTLAFKLIGNASKLTKVKNLKNYIDKTLGKIKGKKAKYLATGATTIATRAGQSSLALGAADILASDGDREITFVDKVDEEGLEGRDLAVARLANKIKFGQEGAVIGAGIPLLGKGLSLGLKYGLFKPGAKVIGIGAQVADAVVVNPLSKIAARIPFYLKALLL